MGVCPHCVSQSIMAAIMGLPVIVFMIRMMNMKIKVKVMLPIFGFIAGASSLVWWFMDPHAPLMTSTGGVALIMVSVLAFVAGRDG